LERQCPVGRGYQGPTVEKAKKKVALTTKVRPGAELVKGIDGTVKRENLVKGTSCPSTLRVEGGWCQPKIDPQKEERTSMEEVAEKTTNLGCKRDGANELAPREKR